MKKVIIYSIRTAAALILILNSCKKAEITRPQITDEELIAKSRANAAMQMAKEGGIPQIFTTKQKVKTQWVDQFGKPVNKEQMQQENFTSACNYSTPASCNLIQYSRVFQCAGSSLGGPGYLLQFEYEISWNSNIVYTGTGGAQTTGSISIISDATSNQVYTASLTAANSEVYITEIGQDPNNSGYYIYH